jgi:2-polyprenyl-3-methyl-5-hydroxy-6-metoxy-1,4-benzoquinol methylase
MNIKTEEIAQCIFCNHSNFVFFDQVDKWRLDKCNNCGYIFTNPRPIRENIHLFYEKEYFKDERHIEKFYNSHGQPIINTGYRNRIIDIENNTDSRGRFLEIGAAFGGFCKTMKDRGWSVDGVEISEDAVFIASNVFGIDLYCGTIEDFHPQKDYDAIGLYQTLEHVYDPKGLLVKVYQILNKGGILVIEVPNVRSFDLLISKERRRLSYDLPRHLSHFTPAFLRKVLKDIGFSVVETDLYYPKFILSLTKLLEKKKVNLNNQSEFISEKQNVNYDAYAPMSKKAETYKTKMLNLVSRVFPGWRFTLIARKV